ncbi:aldehyde dehydrogenase family protein [Pseudomonas typographi]|uniref:Aldehyde dehydrogenase family protein n=1 Tax=Pseudomonas typographi TaxID=2715964 RepID=A0ABR7Z005_9PSED|nr:aldehyde dehydrogenase family protein [Pseudomonas typographi]MBD1550591.1 aldehyde dehydrogenase family protein [Pseudomonas typographi]MBD1586824.1 aldehyde dehydrogenase family protein [Pseudomonas typographi]MBD1598718.1 aldehyde dehydrogenase family protein [Pseudomonas typographi]
MPAYELLIDGQLHPAEHYLDVYDPASEAWLGRAALASPEQVEQAVAAAHAAQASWAEDPALRRHSSARAAALVREHAEALAELVTREQGRPLRFTTQEVAGVAATFDHYAALEVPAAEVLQEDAERVVRVVRKPLGVVAAITPWNVPLILLVLKIAPALHAGNTVVAKPSEHTPLSTLLLASLLKDAFPAGVLNVIAGAGEVGEQLVRQPQVRHITFTGSVATGKRLYGQAAADLKRLTLELGGNDPALVLDDAQVPAIAEALFWGAFWNSGQVCFAIKRVYVHQSLFEPLLQALVERAERTEIGHGLNPNSELGPLTTAAQLQRVEALVEDARRQGAEVHTGGRRLARPGFFYPPTLVSGVNAGVALVDEEQFGPVLPIIPFTDLEDAIAQANASPYGLGASVWTSDPARGEAVAARLASGLAWVNQHLHIHPGAPKGGQKWSGLGYEGGARGYDAFSELQVVNTLRR